MNLEPMVSQVLWSLLFAALGALLKALVDSVRSRFWKRLVRLLSSAFWGSLAAIVVGQWLELSPRSLLAVSALLGWVGYEAVLRLLSKALETRLGKAPEH